MKKENRGGARPGSGRPAIGRQRPNFTTTVSPETKARIKALGYSRKAGKLLDEIVENLFLLASQGEDFEVKIRNGVYSATANRHIFYGQTVRELLAQMQAYDNNDDAQRERYNVLAYMWKYGELDGETTRAFL